jgi:hypothetical protein
MATYPTTPTTLTLTSAFAGSILRDYRDSGFVQGTAVIRGVRNTQQAINTNKVGRQIDLKTARTLSVAGVQTALVTADVLQVVPVDKDSAITGGIFRVVRVASAGGSATATVRLGATALSAAIDLLALGSTVINTATPIIVSADDTVDLLLTGTTSPVFDALVELELTTTVNRG